MFMAFFSRRPFLGAVALVLLAATVSGCSKTSKVSGKVRFDGKELPAGKVTFTPESGTPVFADIKDGEYTLNAPIGNCKITVDTAQLDPEAYKQQNVGIQTGPQMSKEAKEQMDKEKSAHGDEGTAAKVKELEAKYVEIPSVYATVDKSGLTYTVTKGSQTHDIDLAKPADWQPGEKKRKQQEMMRGGGGPPKQ
jgi:hypothetical protein